MSENKIVHFKKIYNFGVGHFDWLHLNLALLFFGRMCFRSNAFIVTGEFGGVEIKRNSNSEI